MRLSKSMLIYSKIHLFLLFFAFYACQDFQKPNTHQPIPWHNIQRSIRYQPLEDSFVITNGTKRFNRALYGSNTAFRVEAGDLPEFALYLPGYGGTIRLALLKGTQSKWLIHANEITTRYIPGAMQYTITDSLLKKGVINLHIIPLYQGEGVIIKMEGYNIPKGVQVGWMYGGATGKKFSRDGDLGADPESVFYLESENCETNHFLLNGDSFDYYFGKGIVANKSEPTSINPSNNNKNSPTIKQHLKGSSNTSLNLFDSELANDLSKFSEIKSKNHLLLGGIVKDFEQPMLLGIFNPKNHINASELLTSFEKAEKDRINIVNRVKIKTPDPYLNTLGSSLAIAADAIWEDPSFQHGAIAWRKPLLGWRGIYAGDYLGWHDRARTHFTAYAKSQYTSPVSGLVMPDPNTNLARQVEKKGNSVFSAGYISRYPGKPNEPHHYDMNLIYIDALIRHIHWTGDVHFLKEMWPLLKRHFDWESRNFDPDNDGLYNAYASIWASDALNYNGGGVAHSSAYNYYALKWAAILGDEFPEAIQFRSKAAQILNALNEKLWIPEIGTYAEYKDNLGNKLLHPQAGLWSIYHLIDSEVSNPFQTYQLLRYIDTQIPHIPIQVDGLNENYFSLSTTNWMPYTWSVNNVALAENLHTSLAYWQGGRTETAFKLFKSVLLESMYNGASPGNFHQLSFYDAMRGELYRDFADPIAMTARSLVEGLFGIKPLLEEKIVQIKPGFPKAWNNAALEIPGIHFSYTKLNQVETYHVETTLNADKIILTIPAKGTKVMHFASKNSKASVTYLDEAIGQPFVKIEIPIIDNVAHLEIEWNKKPIYDLQELQSVVEGETIVLNNKKTLLKDLYDPQSILIPNSLKIKPNISGHKTLFLKVKQDDFNWWEPLNLNVEKPFSASYDFNQSPSKLTYQLRNNLKRDVTVNMSINNHPLQQVRFSARETKDFLVASHLVPGTNIVRIEGGQLTEQKFKIINWDIQSNSTIEPKELTAYFNEKVTQIFKNDYLTPRSEFPTLQLPIHGLGDWCSYNANMEIDDSGLKKILNENESFDLPNGLKFESPISGNNVLFVSKWNNYEDSVALPLSGKASQAYFLMTGTTNPMQSRIENGSITINYTDGSSISLPLVNPDSWWPIEQDYFSDGYAFKLDAPKPYRVHLKTGWIGRDFNEYTSIKSFTNFAIDGGAATIYDLPLDSNKELKSLELKAISNDAIIGLMGLSFLK